MMNYGTFCENVVETIKAALKDSTDKTVVLREVVKNNGVKLKALCINEADTNIAPMLYLEGFYEEYIQENLSFEEVIEHIIITYENAKIGMFSNFKREDLKKENIIGKIINLHQNMDFLKDIPYIKYGEDYAVIFKYLIQQDQHGYQTITITDELAHSQELTEDDLYNLALQNTPELFPVELKSMREVMLEIMGKTMGIEDEASLDEFEELLDEGALSNVNMYVLSNKQRVFGAFTILYPETQKLLRERFQSDLIVIPSSIHELLVYERSVWDNEEELEGIIDNVNTNHVEREEILGDRPFIMKRVDNGAYIPVFPPICNS